MEHVRTMGVSGGKKNAGVEPHMPTGVSLGSVGQIETTEKFILKLNQNNMLNIEPVAEKRGLRKTSIFNNFVERGTLHAIDERGPEIREENSVGDNNQSSD